eukprot:13126177-Alexandrium_andersonii.AAC.1
MGSCLRSPSGGWRLSAEVAAPPRDAQRSGRDSLAFAVWSVNVASWNRHGDALLHDAAEAN